MLHLILLYLLACVFEVTSAVIQPITRYPRLYVNADLSSSAVVQLTEDQSRYLTVVMRLKEGSAVRVFNGREGEYLGELSPIGESKLNSKRKQWSLTLSHQTRTQQESHMNVFLLCAPLRKQKMKMLVEKATELGVVTIWPVITAHTQESLDAEGINRLSLVSIEAAEQSERLTLPKFSPAIYLSQLLDSWNINKDTTSRHLLVCRERSEDSVSIFSALESLNNRNAMDPLALLIGPEGGFSLEEHELLKSYSWVKSVRLGPTILRSESAAIYALSCCSAFSDNLEK